jgi:peptidoglycan/LPS O-acetylase OafA/YrhL
VPGARRRLEVLDGLRLVAALAVVLYHYTSFDTVWDAPTTSLFGPIAIAGRFGWLGVELFFLISGFVICMSTWGRSLGDFFVSRVTRLYPAYWVGVIATACIVRFFGPDVHRPAHELVVNLTMLQRPLGVPAVDGVYWTLWTELHFYLLFAIVVSRGVNYRRTVLFCLVWTAASVLLDQAGTGLPIVSAAIDTQFSSFFIAGVAMYLMHRFRPTYLLWGIIGVSWARSLLTVNGVIRDEIKLPPGGIAHYRLICMLIVTAAYLVMILVALGKLTRVRGRWLTVAGALTYPLYLIHEEIGWAAIRHLRDRVDARVLLPALIAAMLVAAWLIHRLVERPLAPRLKARVRDGIVAMRDSSSTGPAGRPPAGGPPATQDSGCAPGTDSTSSVVAARAALSRSEYLNKPIGPSREDNRNTIWR